MLGRRIGLVGAVDQRGDVTTAPWLEFLAQSKIMTQTQGILMNSPDGLNQYETRSPLWQQYESSTRKQYEFIQNVTANMVKEYAEQGEKFWKSNPEGVPVKPFFAWQYDDVLSGKTSLEELAINVAALHMFGIDIKAGALLGVLFCLAREPRVAAKLREELTKVVGKEVIAAKHLPKLPYLKAVIRETHRLMPSSFNQSKYLDVDMVLDSANGHRYQLPNGTYVNWSGAGLSYDPALFKNVAEFLPERWLEEPLASHKVLNHLLMKFPFGAGPRMCIGTRVTELHLQVVVGEVVRRASLELTDPKAPWEVANQIGPNYPAPMPTFIFKPLRH
jgi:hypothetical protein